MGYYSHISDQQKFKRTAIPRISEEAERHWPAHIFLAGSLCTESPSHYTGEHTATFIASLFIRTKYWKQMSIISKTDKENLCTTAQ